MPKISASSAASAAPPALPLGASSFSWRRNFSSETSARRAKEAGSSSSSGSKSGSGCSETSGPVPIRAARPRKRCTDSQAAARRQ
eukprot:s2316_g14.t1